MTLLTGSVCWGNKGTTIVVEIPESAHLEEQQGIPPLSQILGSWVKKATSRKLRISSSQP